jgi:23S rRNA (cytidine2498-2'-O)-methyltransferase
VDDARPLGVLARTDHDPRSGAHALIGLSRAEQNLSDWAGGMRRFAREPGQVSRAEFKLLEALELFSIPVREHGVALDLGAAPGGWTRVLRSLGQYVTAVDPAELDPRVAGESGVRHKHMTADEYLRMGPDQFDLIVNDMRMDARESARVMLAYAPFLYRHGYAIMTLKLPEEQREPVIEQALKLLRGAYDIVGARQLFHNRSEITVALRPRR